MKIAARLAAALAAIALCLPAAAAEPAAAQVAMTAAVVKKVDPAAGKLTLAHEALPSGMQAMTMAFAVKDKAWLKQVKAGDRVRFALDEAMTVVRLERAP